LIGEVGQLAPVVVLVALHRTAPAESVRCNVQDTSAVLLGSKTNMLASVTLFDPTGLDSGSGHSKVIAPAHVFPIPHCPGSAQLPANCSGWHMLPESVKPRANAGDETSAIPSGNATPINFFMVSAFRYGGCPVAAATATIRRRLRSRHEGQSSSHFGDHAARIL